MGKRDNKKTPQDKPITSDSRFASVHSDPRFRLPNLKNFKVKVDERFSKKELENLNAGSSGKRAVIDRYGRKIKDKKGETDKYYEHESDKSDESDESDEESEEEDSKKIVKPDSEEDEEESSEEEEEDEDVQVTALDRARGEGLASDAESSSDSESDSDSSVNFEESDSEIEIEEGKPEEGDPTPAFAVVNMDWDNLRAVDLMATFVSFVPKNGLIKSVTIYPSEFGKEQMQKEEVEGPPRELFKKKKSAKKVEEDSDSEDELDTSNPADLEKAAKKLYEDDGGEEDYDSKALRRYQLQRLRYYYAVVQCDSVETAQSIYTNCDGTEFESTSNIFDLRYVPEDMDFDDSEAKDVCTKIPTNYKPGAAFVTDALQHSKVKLTWDETPKERLALANRSFSQKEIDDMDFKAYLASDSDDSEDEETKNKYQSLVSSKFKFDAKEREDEDDVDMEITFNPGLDDKKEQPEEKDEEEDTISAYKRKQKERRKNRLDKFKQQKEQDKSAKQDKKSKPTDIDEKSKAELELLMMDENEEQPDNHFDMKDIIKAEKRRGKKGKKAREPEAEDKFEIDLNDDRFKEVFEDHDYAIDPTSADFKKTQTSKKILQERSKRAGKRKHHKNEASDKRVKYNDKPEVKSLVDKIKKRHGH